MVTQERIAELQALGYMVEDVGAEYGSDFAGQYRWLNGRHEGDGFGNIEYSIEDVWAAADRYEKRNGC